MEKIQNRLNKLTQVVKNDQFKTLNGLGNEIPFYIFDYSPESEIEVREYISQIGEITKFDIVICKIDLYEILLEILEEKGYITKSFEMEKEKGTQALEKALKPILKPENIIEKIKSHCEGAELILIYGIGKAFPLVRSHTVLNNLQHVFGNTPVLMFFPGNYNGTELQLFGRLKDDNYYRAFKLID